MLQLNIVNSTNHLKSNMFVTKCCPLLHIAGVYVVTQCQSDRMSDCVRRVRHRAGEVSRVLARSVCLPSPLSGAGPEDGNSSGRTV